MVDRLDAGIARSPDAGPVGQGWGARGIRGGDWRHSGCGRGGANVVRGVSPGGTPWVINKFEAKVEGDGDIKAEGKGLVLAGGHSIGSPDGVTLVAATLFCQTSPGPPATFSAHSSGAHPLAADGDFKFKDTLSPVPPSPCTNPALLIRATSSSGPWLAAGIPD
jgi:hypothetical protein